MRRLLSRASLGIAFLALLAWAASLPCSIFWRVTASGPTVGVGAGALSVLTGPPETSGLPRGSGLMTINRVKMFAGEWWKRQFWLPEWSAGAGRPTQARGPLWMIAVAFGAPGALGLWLARRADFRARTGRCAACGYELAGLARCPECGATAASSAPHSA